MAILSLVATAEALLISASHAKRRWMQRRQLLMGSSPGSCSLPFLDEHMRRKTAGASRLEAFIASRVTEVCRISHEALAEIVGTTRARVSFFINRFRKLGLIDYNGGLEVRSTLLDVVLHD